MVNHPLCEAISIGLWNKTLGICTHSGIRALVMSANEVEQEGLVSSLFPPQWCSVGQGQGFVQTTQILPHFKFKQINLLQLGKSIQDLLHVCFVHSVLCENGMLPLIPSFDQWPLICSCIKLPRNVREHL